MRLTIFALALIFFTCLASAENSRCTVSPENGALSVKGKTFSGWPIFIDEVWK